MNEKKQYRSAIRSKKLIRQAFIEILQEKNFEKITVTDIVKKADINRSTFYAHYPDVIGLIEEIQDEILVYSYQFLEKMDYNDLFENPKAILENIEKLIEQNYELYRRLCNTSVAAQQLEKLKRSIIERILQTLDVPEQYKGSVEIEFTIRFFVGGIIDVYTQWLNGEFDCSLETLTDEFANMMVRISKKFV